ncbi:MAG: hypothetical protein II601_07050, partial [Lachnospiraceae bacterium]|nr:hypothetical protein [Lachnospiraceae bacterium]
MNPELKKELEKFAARIRIGTVECIGSRGFGHIGGSLSICDALSVLYGAVMRVDPENPLDPDRDKLVCSKGHAGPAVYAVLALKGYFPYEKLRTLNRPGTDLPSHCDRKKTVGVDMTTGSLGQGTSLAAGMALGDRIAGRKCRTYLITGDGETDEGQLWEAAMFTAAKKITNLTWLVDWNKKQLDGYTKDILDIFDLEAKFSAFGFDAVTVKGDDVEAIYEALTKEVTDKPRAIILDTVKGAGVKEIEEAFGNHSMTKGPEVFEGWLHELREKLQTLGGTENDPIPGNPEKNAGKAELRLLEPREDECEEECGPKVVYTGAQDSRLYKEVLGKEIADILEKDPWAVYLDADLMSCIGAAKLPSVTDRAIDCGVAEANMIGVAAGLSAVGFHPIAHSFGPFASRRCFDQLFLSVAYAGNSVTVLGTDPGITAAFNGGTHMPFEDMAVYRAIPGAVVTDVTDVPMLKSLLRLYKDMPGLKYIRIPRKESYTVYAEDSRFTVGKGVVLRQGDDVLIVAAGIMVHEALQAA